MLFYFGVGADLRDRIEVFRLKHLYWMYLVLLVEIYLMPRPAAHCQQKNIKLNLLENTVDSRLHFSMSCGGLKLMKHTF